MSWCNLKQKRFWKVKSILYFSYRSCWSENPQCLLVINFILKIYNHKRGSTKQSKRCYLQGLRKNSRRNTFEASYQGTFNLRLCVCVCVCVWVPQSCLTLCDPVDSSQPGSSVHGILQARILEWVAELVLKLAWFPQTV